MNWNKIAANAGVAFFTALVAFNFTSGNLDQAAFGAFLTAFILGGMAFFKEMQIESNPESPKLATLNKLVVF